MGDSVLWLELGLPLDNRRSLSVGQLRRMKILQAGEKCLLGGLDFTLVLSDGSVSGVAIRWTADAVSVRRRIGPLVVRLPLPSRRRNCFRYHKTVATLAFVQYLLP